MDLDTGGTPSFKPKHHLPAPQTGTSLDVMSPLIRIKRRLLVLLLTVPTLGSLAYCANCPALVLVPLEVDPPQEATPGNAK